jgi:nucleoid DNA-binding protein
MGSAAMINEIIKRVFSALGLKETDTEKLKELLNKIEFTVKDGKKIMVVKIGEGVELNITQKD